MNLVQIVYFVILAAATATASVMTADSPEASVLCAFTPGCAHERPSNCPPGTLPYPPLIPSDCWSCCYPSARR
ncbi:hypothetical protein BDR07DRAFT_1430271 [Suillus spraguei]|nr:hypothetical protein BDR07DRAFT_1430271 [Suillus spraguei]